MPVVTRVWDKGGETRRPVDSNCGNKFEKVAERATQTSRVRCRSSGCQCAGYYYALVLRTVRVYSVELVRAVPVLGRPCCDEIHWLPHCYPEVS
jgi:hypothetical protein